MKSDKKKKMFTFVVLFLFVGSSIAIAFLSVPSGDDAVEIGHPEFQVKSSYNYPLTNYEEAYFLQRNIVVLKYFYTPGCEGCRNAENTVSQMQFHLGSNIIVQKIDMDKYLDESRAMGVETVPTFYIKGKTIETLPGSTTEVELLSKMCSMFFTEIDACS